MIESGQLKEEDAKKMQLFMNDFTTWESVQDQQREAIAVIEKILGSQQKPLNQYAMAGAIDVGTIRVFVYPTNEPRVHLTVFKYKDGSAVWGLRPDCFEEEV